MRTTHACRIAILADDLTSAADGAAPFVARGEAAVIGRGRMPPSEGRVVAVDSGSRSLPARQAASRVATLAGKLATRDILFKTVDSTLRGNVTAELEAAFEASGRKTLVFAPAFPAAGRTTTGGVQHVDGVEVAKTLYGRDPIHPARHSRLLDLVPKLIASPVILDAATQEDLDAQIDAMPDPESVLWVGSPGMASALAKRLVPSARAGRSNARASGGIVVAIGSANARSHRQADRIAKEPGITLVRAPVPRQDDPATVLGRIGDKAVELLRGGGFDTVIATGGDTMEAILDRLGIEELEILREIEPGFPLGRAVMVDGRDLLIAMKAGGLGDEDALRRAIAELCQPAV